MKVITLDKRYANYPKFGFAIDHTKEEKWPGTSRNLQRVMYEELTKSYGPDFTWLPGTGFKREFSDLWWYSRQKQRFYFRDESMITHIMLLLS